MFVLYGDRIRDLLRNSGVFEPLHQISRCYLWFNYIDQSVKYEFAWLVEVRQAAGRKIIT
jgi:hypothetical protein